MAPDLAPATNRTAALVRAVRDDQLGQPTPCDFGVGDLLDHLRTLSLAFTAAATKADDEIVHSPPPPPDAANLDEGWRDHIAGLLDRLAAAWADPAASEGMTKAGGLDLPGEVAGVIALDEVVLHGWDLAVSTGQAYGVDDASLEPLLPFLTHVAEPGMEAGREGCSARWCPSPTTLRCSIASWASPAATRAGEPERWSSRSP